MPRGTSKQAKVGRNDPCWCGSGKKYKDCHLPVEDAQRTEQRKLRQAHDTLLPKILEVAEQMPEAFPAAFALFWQGQYSPQQMSDLDDLEDRGPERFLTWFAFDYAHEDGRTLVEKLAEAASQGDFEVDAFEARLLHAWLPVRLRPYVVLEVRKGKGFTVRDLLDEQVCQVEEHSASRRVQVDEVLVGHVLPVGGELIERTLAAEAEGSPAPLALKPVYTVAGAVAQLTGDTRAPLLEFVGLHLEDMRRAQPDATLDSLVRQRSHVLNHFVMQLPKEHNPGMLQDIVLQTRTALQVAGVLPVAESDSGSDEGAATPPPEAAAPAADESSAAISSETQGKSNE